ncbi:MAG: alpha/beta hydrolase [Proteobacteria bacterium]|nr:alpha/beta hydrolase [Pseudomonadota bacterium]
MPEYHPFRSTKARGRYLKLYDESALSWPVQSETRTVETPSGETFFRVSGPGDGMPLVLLPSASATSLFWKPNIVDLSKTFRVYALDNIYDFGRSIFRKPFKEVNDYTDWLDSLFDRLKLGDQVNLMGHSYGAWLTGQYALRFPERLGKIVMISPPATVKQLPGAWAWYGLTALIPHRYFLRNMVRWMMPELSRGTDPARVKMVEALLEEAFVGMRCFKLKMPVSPSVLTDDELRRLSSVPTLFLVGDQEVLYPAEEAIARLKAVAPKIETRIVQGAGHDITIVQAEAVNRIVADYLS